LKADGCSSLLLVVLQVEVLTQQPGWLTVKATALIEGRLAPAQAASHMQHAEMHVCRHVMHSKLRLSAKRAHTICTGSTSTLHSMLTISACLQPSPIQAL
jgi:hypothetical protein